MLNILLNLSLSNIKICYFSLSNIIVQNKWFEDITWALRNYCEWILYYFRTFTPHKGRIINRSIIVIGQLLGSNHYSHSYSPSCTIVGPHVTNANVGLVFFDIKYWDYSNTGPACICIVGRNFMEAIAAVHPQFGLMPLKHIMNKTRNHRPSRAPGCSVGRFSSPNESERCIDGPLWLRSSLHPPPQNPQYQFNCWSRFCSWSHKREDNIFKVWVWLAGCLAYIGCLLLKHNFNHSRIGRDINKRLTCNSKLSKLNVMHAWLWLLTS